MATSFSALKLYQQCPLKYRIERILKHTPPPSATPSAADRGTLIHSMAEAYIKKEVTDLPFELARFRTDLDKMRDSRHCTPEARIAVDSNLQPVDFDDDTAWVRGIIDVLQLNPPMRRATVTDWKSGKVRDYNAQLTFYALLVFCQYPDVDRVYTEIKYTDTGKTTVGPIILRNAVEQLQGAITQQLAIITKDKVFAPNPSYLCEFCPWNKKKGGPCKY